MAPRGKRTPKAKPENTLLTALQFVAAAQKANGAIEQTHCRMFGGWVTASNSILSAGHALTEDIQACPHTYTIVDALTQAPGAVSVTILDETRLSVRSADFQAVVPLIDATALPPVMPDAAVALCDDRLRAALSIAGGLVVDGAEKIVNASVQVRGSSVLASNGTVILEAWHGISLPPLMIVPKTFITALQKNKKVISRCGGCDHSFTLWFEDNNWLKTQLYPANTELPNLTKFLDVPTTPIPVAKGMFDVVRRLEPFAADGMISFTAEGARVISGTTYAIDHCADLPVGVSFSIKALLSIAEYAKTIHFNATPGITLFFGDNVRGAIVNQIG